MTYRYVIVGGGLAGASAIQSIRERDRKGSILLIGAETHNPYDRPPLTKKLWLGKKKVEEIFIHGPDFYLENEVVLSLGRRVAGIDPSARRLTDDKGNEYHYEKLLLATGGVPRSLPIPGGDLQGVCYYRYLDDYLRMRDDAAEKKPAVVIGGGFIGSEIAAALNMNGIDVTMIFPEEYPVSRIFPESLGKHIQRHYIEKGVNMIPGDKPVSIAKNGTGFVTLTEKGLSIKSGIVIIGIGIKPSMELAQAAGLETGNGIVVDEYLRTSHEHIYAAGDNAFFPYQALGKKMRVEHWDNALNQGMTAGRNMAGAREQYSHMPYFFSDLFEFGYEAVGEIDSALDTFADWKKENDTGVIYYLKEGHVRGAMMCNVWDKVDDARRLIATGAEVAKEGLAGAIG